MTIKHTYHDMTTRELLQDYGAARHELAALASDIRETRAELARYEAEALLNVTGSNDTARKANLAASLRENASYQEQQRYLAHFERRKDELDAEIDVISKFLQDRQWAIRLRQVEALERQGQQGESVTDTLSDHMSNGNANSDYYAGKPRPKPTYSMLGDGDVPF